MNGLTPKQKAGVRRNGGKQMDNDLISRSALLKELEEKVYPEKYGERCNAFDVIYAVLQVIEEQPAAYDVDKVVERMKQNSQNIELIYPTDQGYDYEDAIGLDVNKAIEIVRAEKGGIMIQPETPKK